jgi:hypothetical protein
MTRICLVLLACCWLPAAPPRAEGSSVPRYEVFEVTLTSSKSYANPFLDVTVRVTFTAPSGRKLAPYGFHDGGSTWRIRLTADEPGTWRYVTTASDTANRGLHGQAGKFTCVASSNKGFIRADPRRKYYFSFSDGSPFFALGDTCSLTSPTLTEANRKVYLDARAGKPFNFLRTMSVTNVFNAWTGEVQIKSPDGWPWGGTPVAPDYDRLNPSYFRRFERILRELQERGIHAEIVVFNYYEKPFKFPALWTPERERLWARYLISRLAPFTTVFLWTVTQEYERYPDGQYRYDPSDDEWVRHMASLIHETDPHKHPVTVHPWKSSSGSEPKTRGGGLPAGEIGLRFGTAPELDVLTHQENSYGDSVWIAEPPPGYQDGPAENVSKAILADRKYDKPVINTEYGYEWLKGYPTHFNQQAHGTDKCRRAAWRLFVGGAAGLSAGLSGTFLASDNAEVYFDRTKRFAPFIVTDMGHVAQLGYLYAFVTARTAFHMMNPCPSLVNTPNLCLANPGKEYIVYAPSGGAITIDLSGAFGKLAVEWLNPRTGVYQRQTTVQAGDKRILTAPDENDWVLHLKKAK